MNKTTLLLVGAAALVGFGIYLYKAGKFVSTPSFQTMLPSRAGAAAYMPVTRNQVQLSGYGW